MSSKTPRIQEMESVTIRFAGDSGDGMQLTGSQFTQTTAIIGNDLATFADYPSEIRAPAGSLPGVSGFQICFASHPIRTHGDILHVLVAMNPAALKVHLKDLERGGLLILNSSAFIESNFQKAGYTTNPIEDGSLSNYRVIQVPISRLNSEALQSLPLSKKDQDRSKNFYALGFMYWLYSRPLELTEQWIENKFAKVPAVAQANLLSLRAGYKYGSSTQIFETQFSVRKANLPKGTYRQITGNQAIALGIVTTACLAKKPVFYGSYPITPASEILHELSNYKNFNVRTFQAEDEIAAIGVSIGASYGGHLAVTGTSGPGLALKTEAIGLAVMAELPLVIIDVQRAGPSTGMPTKIEQADLLQALFGRPGESPIVVLAAATPGECFYWVIEAFRIATRYMCPVMLLSDSALANSAEPWAIPSLSSLQKFSLHHEVEPSSFQPYQRDEKTLARPWVLPGTKGLEHQIGGLEKQDGGGNVSYDPLNHEKMVRLRAEKIERVTQEIPPTEVFGPPKGKVLVVGWGSTYGAITTAVEDLQKEGKSVSSVHLRFLNPLPKDLGSIFSQFEKVLVPELNAGQLRTVLRARYLIDAQGLNKIQGQPLKIREVKERVNQLL